MDRYPFYYWKHPDEIAGNWPKVGAGTRLLRPRWRRRRRQRLPIPVDGRPWFRFRCRNRLLPLRRRLRQLRLLLLRWRRWPNHRLSGAFRWLLFPVPPLLPWPSPLSPSSSRLMWRCVHLSTSRARRLQSNRLCFWSWRYCCRRCCWPMTPSFTRRFFSFVSNILFSRFFFFSFINPPDVRAYAAAAPSIRGGGGHRFRHRRNICLFLTLGGSVSFVLPFWLLSIGDCRRSQRR